MRHCNSIVVRIDAATVILSYRARTGDGDWENVEQRVRLDWMPCTFGGQRCWLVCRASSNDVYYGRRIAKLYGAGRYFACRHCYHIAYASQSEGPDGCCRLVL